MASSKHRPTMRTSAFARQQFADELQPDEQLLWTGQPDPARHLTSTDVFLIPLSIAWCAFAIFWESMVLGSLGSAKSPPLFFAVWGIPFVLMGLYMVVGRFFIKASRKRRTYYAVTDRRALILIVGRKRRLDSVPLAGRADWTSSLRADGSGDIVFGSTTQLAVGARMYANSGMEAFARNGRSKPLPLAFYDLPDARTVTRLLDLRS